MNIEQLYDDIANNYSETLAFIGFKEYALVILNQITTHLSFLAGMNIIDLGVGDGMFLSMLYPSVSDAKLWGVDISKKLLEIAQKKVPLTPVNNKIEAIQQIMPQGTMNLVLAHMICVHIDLPTILEQANFLLKEKGYCSISTRTVDSFPHLQSTIQSMKKSFNPFKKILYHICSRYMKKSSIPQNKQTIINVAKQYNFDIIHTDSLIANFTILSKEEAFNVAYNTGIMLDICKNFFLPPFLLTFIIKKIFKLFKYPFSDCSVTEILLLQKK